MNAQDWLSRIRLLLDEEKHDKYKVLEHVDTGQIFGQLSIIEEDESIKRELAKCFSALEELRLQKLFSARGFYEKNMRSLFPRERDLFQKVLDTVDNSYTKEAKIVRDWAFGKRERV